MLYNHYKENIPSIVEINNQLPRDNVPTVCLHQVPLEAEMLDEDFFKGVKPLLFAVDPSIGEAALLAKPILARKDIMRLQRLFFAPETVSPKEAIQVAYNLVP